jgi:hypothetical protein
MKAEITSGESVCVYLFQTDPAKDNRPFFEGMRDSTPESVYFRGLDFKVAPWKPDGVRVDLAMYPAQRCSLALIELEPTGPMAVTKSRKYSHESSTRIFREFMKYLDSVIKDCNSRADPRESKIVFLRDALTQNTSITVRTAAALKSSTTYLEEIPFLDQETLIKSDETQRYYAPTEEKVEQKQLEIRNKGKFSPEESKVLRRCIQILDAIIREKDGSDAAFHSWLEKSPLKNFLNDLDQPPPELERLIVNQRNSGVRVDNDQLFSELVEIWRKHGKNVSTKNGQQIDSEIVIALIEDYSLTAMKIGRYEKMSRVFDAAETHVARFLGTPPE